MRFENTVRGWSSAMTSESGSFTAGRSRMKYGLLMVDRPECPRHHGRHHSRTTDTTMKTVLITGCSSGYGLETARHFHSQGWNVIATMRTPNEDALPRSGRIRVLALDVTK